MTADTLARLREDLTVAGFQVGAVDALWGSAAAEALFRGRLLPARRAIDRLRESDALTPAGILADLFVLGRSVSRDDAHRAAPRTGVDGLVDLGLVRATEESVVPLADLRPYEFTDALGAGQWWIRSDLGEAVLGRPLDEDHVLGIGGASTTLAGLAVPGAVDFVLDLGTGCGIQAMHAARHARRVVATDISARALEIARFNLDLNGIEGVELRHGSLYDPVAGERFDRIVSNPPFVITPRTEGVPRYEYRDGGRVGDALVRAVIQGAAEHLAPGGIAQLLGNWEYRADEDGLDRVRSWIEPLSLDAWVVERERQDAATYSETWIRDGGTLPGTAAFDRLYGAWLDDFADRGVQSVGLGYVLLRRPVGEPTLARYERLPDGGGASRVGLGEHLSACLIGHDWSAARDDEGVLAARLAYASDITEERHYWPGSDDPVVMTLVQGGGFARRIDLTTELAGLVGASDGDLALGAIVAALAEVLDVPEPAIRDSVLPRVRELLDDGMLVPVG
ncbi:methyltransferase [Cnuibacter physcomitrellae]|uniref:SAM-dependent methyltransferase n=1 Tax=Cnuibacter physcomitrellae TaxID=1619308 RepID=A0A1X9LKH2_9MICO|nr:methyltransferase [Cnuibacter physcomitrellae]ARJ04788.1 SAM-dependent methyltransferase [Cnuibacter physcomitrellae]GGI41879.1 methyltransferase [Cnuibacter physcomitrellae]